MTTHRTPETLPEGWTPEADSDRQWKAITALMREADTPRIPGEERWEEIRLAARREAGIADGAAVVPIAIESRSRPSYIARVMQIAAVGVAAFALGWFLSPTQSAEESPLMASAGTSQAGTSITPGLPTDDDKLVITHGDAPGRVTPTVPRDGSAPIPVSANGSVPLATPRHVVIREGSNPPVAVGLSDGADSAAILLPDFLRTLRAQPGQTIPADAVLDSITNLLGEETNPANEAALRFLRAEILLLEKSDRVAALAEYETVLRITNGEGVIAGNARSRLASLRD